MGHSIYLADDEKSIRELLHSFLTSGGYTVRSFENGDALLEAFHQEQKSRLWAGKRGGALLQTHESGKAGMEHFHGFRLRAIDGCQGRDPFHQPFPQHSRFRHPVPPFQNGLDGRKGFGISLFQPGKQVFFRFRKVFLLDFVQRGAATLLIPYP